MERNPRGRRICRHVLSAATGLILLLLSHSVLAAPQNLAAVVTRLDATSSSIRLMPAGGTTTSVAPSIQLNASTLKVLSTAANVVPMEQISSLDQRRVNATHTNFYEIGGLAREGDQLRQQLVALDPETLEMVRLVKLAMPPDPLGKQEPGTVRYDESQVPELCLGFLKEQGLQMPEGYGKGSVKPVKVGPFAGYELTYRHTVTSGRTIIPVRPDFVRFEVDATTGEVISYSKVHHPVKVPLEPKVPVEEAQKLALEGLRSSGFETEEVDVRGSSLAVVYPNNYLARMQRNEKQRWGWSEEQALCWIIPFFGESGLALEVWVDAHTGELQGGEQYENPASQLFAVPNQHGDAYIQKPYLDMMQCNTANTFTSDVSQASVVSAMNSAASSIFILHTHGNSLSSGEYAVLNHYSNQSFDGRTLVPGEIPSNQLRYALISCCYSGNDNPGDDFKDTFIAQGADCFQGYEGSINPDSYEESQFYYLAKGYTVINADAAAAAATSPPFNRTFTWKGSLYNSVRLAPLFVTLSKAAPGTAAPGTTLEMEAHVTNWETARLSSAQNVTAQLVLPSGFSIVSGTNPQSLGTVTYGDTKTATWTVEVDAGTSTGTYTFDAVVRSDNLGVEVDEPNNPYNLLHPCDVEVGWPFRLVVAQIHEIFDLWWRIDPDFRIPAELVKTLEAMSSGEVDPYQEPELFLETMSQVLELQQAFEDPLTALGSPRDVAVITKAFDKSSPLLAQALESEASGPALVDRIAVLQSDILASASAVLARGGYEGHVAYVYANDTAAANSYKSLLNANGISVDLVSVNNIESTDWGPYEAILIGSDTGFLTSWGEIPEGETSLRSAGKPVADTELSSSLTRDYSISADFYLDSRILAEPVLRATAVTVLKNAGKPIIGLGEGGYAFFGKLGLQIGHGNGWHGSETSIHVPEPEHPVFQTPNEIYIEREFGILQLYNETGHVGIYLESVPEDVTALGREVSDVNHYPLVLEEEHYALWGFTESPNLMTPVGKELFINLLYHMRTLYQPPRVKSVWASTAPAINGQVGAGEWSSTPLIPLANGNLRFQNDGDHLYILVDLTGDTHENSPSGDFPWVSFDVGADKTITPGEDINYAPRPNTYDLGLQEYLGPSIWTELESTASLLGAGFGASPASATPHRIWEFAVALDEIGENSESWLSDEAAELPLVRLGMKTHSQQPAFNIELPWNFCSDFSNLMEVLLAMKPSYAKERIFSGVGLIPRSEIEDGYATTVPSYHLHVEDAPFGARLHIIGNFDELRDRGASYYKVLCSKVGSSDPPVELRQSWTNYLLEEDPTDPNYGDYVPQTIAPDDLNRYRVPPASEEWYVDDLLIEWRTWAFPNGLYTLELEAYTSSASPVYLPAADNQLTLMVDNTRPNVEITAITHAGEPIGRCEIVSLGDAPDGLRFTFTASDPEKHLYSYSLAGHYGDNDHTGIESESYSAHVDEDGLNLWEGATDLTIPAPASNPWRPPESCAYQFRLVARDRTTNGYSRLIHRREYNKHVTLLLGELTGQPDMSFTTQLTRGLNLMSLPLDPGVDRTARSLLERLGGTVIWRMAQGSFIPFLPSFPGDGFVIEGGQGYVLNILSDQQVTFSGTGWSNDGTPKAAPAANQPTWAFAVGGMLQDASAGQQYVVAARNLRTGETATDQVGSLHEDCFALTWLDMDGESVVEPGDRLEITLADPRYEVSLGSIVHHVSAQDLTRACVVLPLSVKDLVPQQSVLLANYPNPFNPSTTIPYVLEEDARVLIRVYDVSGHLVRTLDLGRQKAGLHAGRASAAYWDGTDDAGRPVASGVYFASIQAGRFSATRKMLLMK